MAVRNVTGGTPTPKKGSSEPKPFKGSRKCASCGHFFKEEYMVEKTVSGRFDDEDYKRYYCRDCADDEGVTQGNQTRTRYDHGTEGYGWSNGHDPKLNWDWDRE